MNGTWIYIAYWHNQQSFAFFKEFPCCYLKCRWVFARRQLDYKNKQYTILPEYCIKNQIQKSKCVTLNSKRQFSKGINRKM